MLSITPQMRILVAVNPVEFRRGIDGLGGLCRQVLRQDPFSGCAFVSTTADRPQPMCWCTCSPNGTPTVHAFFLRRTKPHAIARSLPGEGSLDWKRLKAKKAVANRPSYDSSSAMCRRSIRPSFTGWASFLSGLFVFPPQLSPGVFSVCLPGRGCV